MTQHTFKTEAAVIVKRNVSERVDRVLATFDASKRHLKVVYVLDAEPSDADREDCELTCAELIAAFPAIRTAETSCLSVADRSVDDHEAIVFQRE